MENPMQFLDTAPPRISQAPLGYHYAANDNASPRDDFLTILDAGIDPVGLWVGLRGAQDAERRFLNRLRNLARALRCERSERPSKQRHGLGFNYASMTPEQAGVASLAEAQAICRELAGPAQRLPAGAVGYMNGGVVPDPEIKALKARAKTVRCEHYLAGRGWQGRKEGHWIVGPCPDCGQGDNRFFIDPRTNVWGLRTCDHGLIPRNGSTAPGGDVIALAEWLEGSEFIPALEKLAGERAPRPNRRTSRYNGGAPTNKSAKPVPDWSRGQPFEYRDAENMLLYRNVRYPLVGPDGSPVLSRKGKPDKTFVQEYYDWVERRWIRGRGPHPAIPYKLPELVEALQADRTAVEVYVVEGEAKVEVLRAWGLIATSFPKGCDGIAEVLAGASVVLTPDNDKSGRDYRDHVARKANGHAASMRLLELPVAEGSIADGYDIIDWIKDGGKVESFLLLAERAPVFEAPSQPVSPEPELEPWPGPELEPELGPEPPPPKPGPQGSQIGDDINKPVITCSGGTLHENASAGEAALIRADTPFYTRGHAIVMPIVEEVDAARGGKTKVARVKRVDADCLTDHMSRVATFQKYDARVKGFVKINPPTHVAKTILSRDGEWKFRPVAGVITTPTLRRDGTLLIVPGYDPETKLLLMAPPVMPPMPENPSEDDAEAAFALLNGLLDEFPFVDDASRSVALSGLITPVVRGAMNVAPLHATNAHTAGTGKSYQVELCYAIATGQSPPALAAGRTEEETEKRLAAAVIAGQSVITVDNLNGEFGGDFLCQLVERTRVQVRILGLSKLVETECRATVFVNGNNITPKGADIIRRTLMCSLDANMERPELRTFAGNPLAAILTDRGKYVAAAITIVRAFIAAGKPCRPPTLASYEEWTDMVRAPLMWLGCADPVETQKRARENDPDLLIFLALMAELGKLVGPGYSAKTVGQIKEAADERMHGSYDPDKPRSYVRPELRRVLLEAAGHRDEIDSVKLGKRLGRFEGRIADGMKLVSGEDNHNKQKVWSVRKIGKITIVDS
jgi:hypothetical protein